LCGNAGGEDLSPVPEEGARVERPPGREAERGDEASSGGSRARRCGTGVAAVGEGGTLSGAYRWNSGRGRPKKNPCIRSQSRATSASRSSADSTPSATTEMPMLRERETR